MKQKQVSIYTGYGLERNAKRDGEKNDIERPFIEQVKVSNSGVTVVVFKGVLDMSAALSVRKVFDCLFVDGRRKVVLNMEKSLYVSIGFLEEIIRNTERFNIAGGEIVISNVDHGLEKDFRKMDLSKVIGFFGEEQKAVGHFSMVNSEKWFNIACMILGGLGYLEGIQMNWFNFKMLMVSTAVILSKLKVS